MNRLEQLSNALERLDADQALACAEIIEVLAENPLTATVDGATALKALAETLRETAGDEEIGQ